MGMLVRCVHFSLGFALLPDYVGHGYAFEAARGLMGVRVGDQGARFTFRFCPVCGTTGFHSEEGNEQSSVSVAVGAFADAVFPGLQISVYECRRHPWVQMPSDIRTYDRGPPALEPGRGGRCFDDRPPLNMTVRWQPNGAHDDVDVRTLVDHSSLYG